MGNCFIVSYTAVLAALLQSGSSAVAQRLRFDMAVNYWAGSRPYSVVAADPGGDDDADMAAANDTCHNVSV